MQIVQNEINCTSCSLAANDTPSTVKKKIVKTQYSVQSFRMICV